MKPSPLEGTQGLRPGIALDPPSGGKGPPPARFCRTDGFRAAPGWSYVISGICTKYGYSPTWLLMGTGDKKLKGDEAKLVTEIQMLRAEMSITATLNLKLQARLNGVENEYEDLKKELQQLKTLINK